MKSASKYGVVPKVLLGKVFWVSYGCRWETWKFFMSRYVDQLPWRFPNIGDPKYRPPIEDSFIITTRIGYPKFRKPHVDLVSVWQCVGL